MTDYGTIKIPHDEYERHNEQRQDMDLTWAEYIDGQAPEVPNGGEVDPDDLAERLDGIMNKLEQLEGAQADTVSKSLELADISNHDVLEQLDTIEDAAKEATEAAQSAQNAVDKLAEARR